MIFWLIFHFPYNEIGQIFRPSHAEMNIIRGHQHVRVHIPSHLPCRYQWQSKIIGLDISKPSCLLNSHASIEFLSPSIGSCKKQRLQTTPCSSPPATDFFVNSFCVAACSCSVHITFNMRSLHSHLSYLCYSTSNPAAVNDCSKKSRVCANN